ncbi:hypothetical protein [Alicyclobacillus sp. ALC3]|uniref:hypothetical protein n=1 Tax=Alicyclobacillus sp. ALC3 TaxID=2796143 RepID=UPI0023790CBB|nr:hypothetical protein [Alicyclobacillus sp. ALC3]WDL97889.1 hypothetical protein JC200_04005 [Alicyclobacillus sp. ALC3]
MTTSFYKHMAKKFPVGKITERTVTDIKLNHELRTDDEAVDYLIRNDPMKFVSQALSGLEYKEVFLSLDITTDFFDRLGSTIPVYCNPRLHGFSRIVSAALIEYGILDEECYSYNQHQLVIDEVCANSGGLTSLNARIGFECSLHIQSYNQYTGELFVIGHAINHNVTLSDLDGHEIVGKIGCIALPVDSSVQTWIECLVDSILDHQNGNKKMAFFNSFAAMDQIIQRFYRGLFEFYLSKSRRGITDELRRKVKKYANDNRRLDEKLDDVAKELGISDFGKMQCRAKYKELTTTRDSIAHGGMYDLSTLDMGGVYITVFSLLVTLFNAANVEQSGWGLVVSKR